MKSFSDLSNTIRGKAFDATRSQIFTKPATSFRDVGEKGIHFASAKVSIDGGGTRKLHTFSGNQYDMSQVLPNQGFVPNSNRAVLPYSAAKGGNAHSEWRILNDIAQSGITGATKGKVTLYSELMPCSGNCMDTIQEFSNRFPRIKVSVIYVTPQAGYVSR